jgi:L-lactate dehydrogenase complex protein LldG
MTTTAREAILSRITTAIGQPTGDPAAEWAALQRDYIRADSLTGTALIELFEHRLKDYGAGVYHCTADQIRVTVGQILSARNARRLVVAPGTPHEWLPENITFVEDRALAYTDLDQMDGVLTGATVAIAATGSIVLQHGDSQGRRALTLIPDYHLCVVWANQVVQTVPASFAKLDGTKPTTFISGPSATADIEMTRIKGVHGPRFMDVVLVG